jgi:outer membrane protein assembly factor BamA
VSRFLGEHGRIAGMFSLFVMHSDQPGKTLSPDNTDTLVRVGASVGWDTRDNWNNPRRGWLNELEVWKTGGALGGDGDFWTMNADVRRWLAVGDRQRVLLSGLLTLQSGTVGEQIPVYLEYHLGGANTIRGYDVEVLGRQLYGKNQLLGTVEHSFTLVRARRFDLWKVSLRLGVELALFADGGIAWSESPDLALRKARGGIGAGLRLLTPVSEMVRLDVGWSPPSVRG